ncbi:MAG TPA: hypothetical protein VK550_25655 [Polyangiaceae bacterium]|nr:hypothetical protein [Polyangiaceae bacterium]
MFTERDIRTEGTEVTCDTAGIGDQRQELHPAAAAVGARHLLLVTGDGTVRYARDRYQQISSIPGDESGHHGYGAEPGRRCQLKPPGYFDGCIAAVQAPQGSDAWACAFGDGGLTVPSAMFWFESCTDASPLTCD